MVQDRSDSLNRQTDQEYIKRQMKAIKEAKKAGNERKAQRLADELLLWLGWNDGF